MALPVDPSLALSTVQLRADHQGSLVDERSEEVPGKILREVRLDVSNALTLGGKSAYYGSVDATPKFVALFGEVSCRRYATDTTAGLIPRVRSAKFRVTSTAPIYLAPG